MDPARERSISVEVGPLIKVETGPDAPRKVERMVRESAGMPGVGEGRISREEFLKRAAAAKGCWTGDDGLTYQNRVRDEWHRE